MWKKKQKTTYAVCNYRVDIVTPECQILGGPPLLLRQGKDEPLAIPVPKQPAIIVSAYNLDTDEQVEIATYEAAADTEEAQTILEAAGWEITGTGNTLAEGFYTAPVDAANWNTLLGHLADKKRNAGETDQARAATALRFVVQDAISDEMPIDKIAAAANLTPEDIDHIRNSK